MCPFCRSHTKATKKGFYRKGSGRPQRVQRFLCKCCHRRFSDQTSALTYRAKKPHIDQVLARLLTRGVSQRAAAEILGVDKKTVARKLVRLGGRAEMNLETSLSSGDFGETVVFDEMETLEHSKCKPLSIAVAVEEGSRRIIAAEVSQMPAKGRLADIAKRRYGYRHDCRKAALVGLCRKIKIANPDVKTVKSDECPRYPIVVRKYLPKVVHQRSKSRRACTVGQGEMKVGGRDPLFSLNHTCAMYRDNLKRLSRRTWCTTKRPENLQHLVNLYAWFHNEKLRGVRRLVTV